MKISKNGKVMFAKPYKSRVLAYSKDWYMTNYHLIVNCSGKYLKWYEKLALWTFCKIEDLKASVIKGCGDIFSR